MFKTCNDILLYVIDKNNDNPVGTRRQRQQNNRNDTKNLLSEIRRKKWIGFFESRKKATLPAKACKKHVYL
jgi:hypothetical protein